ncbi:NAD-dependent epimerase/dehydratase family protein [Lentzea fradiae]|uniref:NAD-dependent epimerase/dehydratase family protein n=1 Tax=Lentzea fradiae TaxID=200378 RepID=UPI00115F9A83|nr:NAD-dependent epimerase/dehydratase family protein [Lentzea fradiae]
MKPHVMIVGAGLLGYGVLELLMRRSEDVRITVVGTDREQTRRRANLALHAVTQMGYYPSVEADQVDLFDVDRTAELIARVAPDVIFTTASLQPWWQIFELPKALAEEIDRASIGPWLPMQLTLVYHLMQAVRRAGSDAKVVNAALPDVTHALLDTAGLAPTIGVGNVANVVPGLRRAAADLLDVPLRSVQLRLVAEAFVSSGLKNDHTVNGAPYLLHVLVDDVDRTADVSVPDVVRLLSTRYARIGARDGTRLTAASALTVLDAVLDDTGAVVHAPGPNALIGGYPVRVWRDRVELALPEGVTEQQAREVNERAMVFDGIAEVRPDGTAVYTPENMAIIEKFLGYSARTVHLDESRAQAEELGAAYRAFRDGLS